MSIKVMAEIWKYSKHGGSALLVLLAIGDHVNGTGIAFPGIKHLAKKTKLSSRQVLRIIKLLELSGELIVNRDKHYNVYSIVLSDNMSPSDNMSVSDGDIQGVVGDIQGVVGDIQGQKGDMAVSLKSLTIKETINENIIVSDNSLNLKTEAEEIWEKLLNALEREKNKLFHQISYLNDVSLDSDVLTVWVSTLGEADYLNDRAARTIERILVGIVARSIHVKFAIKVHEYSHV